MFSCTNENNWTLCGSNCTESTSTLCMAIEFGDNDLTNFNGLVESFCLIITCLTNRTIHDEDRCVRLNCSLNLEHFIKKRLFLFMTTRCINNNNFILFLSKESNTFFCNFHRISFILMTKEGTLNFCRVHLELSKSTSSECISTYQTNSPSSLHKIVG
jgi:hypothetical protein